MTNQKQDTKPDLTLLQRLHAVMKDVSYIKKEDKKVNGQYGFVSHDAVTAKVRSALVDHRIFAVSTITSVEQDGNRTCAYVKITFINIDNSDEQMSVDCFGYGVDNQDKGPGKAVSYAVKYGLLKFFMLETGDDVEKHNIDHKPQTERAKWRAKKPDPNAPMEKEELSEEYPRIKLLFEQATTQNQCSQIFSVCNKQINRMPDKRISILQDLRDRFNEDEEVFPGDLP